MGVVMGITAAVVAIAAGLVGLMVWTALIFPWPTERAAGAVQERPWHCFGLGLALAALLGAPVIALLNAAHGLAKMAGWGLALPLAALLLVGLTAMARVLGERMEPLSPSVTPLGGLVRGAVTLELAMLPPFLGWFVFAPLLAVTVLGAGALGCGGRRKGSTRRHGDTEGNGREQRAADLLIRSDEELDTVSSSHSESPCLRVSGTRASG
jgi:hypothetical protein